MTVVLLVTFLAEIWVNDWQFAPISTNPLLGPDSDALVAMGAKVPLPVRHVGSGGKERRAIVNLGPSRAFEIKQHDGGGRTRTPSLSSPVPASFRVFP